MHITILTLEFSAQRGGKCFCSVKRNILPILPKVSKSHSAIWKEEKKTILEGVF